MAKVFTAKEIGTLSDKNALFRDTKTFTNKKLQEILTDMEVPFESNANKGILVGLVAGKANELRLSGTFAETVVAGESPRPDDVKDAETGEGGTGTDSERELEGEGCTNTGVEPRDDEEAKVITPEINVAALVQAIVSREIRPIQAELSKLADKVERLTAAERHAKSTFGSVDNLGSIDDLNKK